MTWTPPPRIEHVTSAIHRWLYRRTGGRIGGSVGRDRRPVALLATTGRRTGQRRERPVLCMHDGVDVVVVASNAGRDQHPAWYLNAVDHPECEVQIGAERRLVRARDATVEEADRLWPRLRDLHDGFADYQQRTDRDLPIVILEPVDTGRR